MIRDPVEGLGGLRRRRSSFWGVFVPDRGGVQYGLRYI